MSGIPALPQFDGQTRRNIVYWIARGVPREEAARRASVPASARLSAYFRTKHFAEDLREAIRDQLETEMAPKAMQRLAGILNDEQAPPKVVLDAVKTTLDRAGHPAVASAKLADPDDAKRPEEMTPTELAALIERLEREKSGRAVHVGGPEEPTAVPASFLD